MDEDCLLFKITFKILLLVDLKNKFFIKSLINVLLELYIKYTALSTVLLVTIDNNILMKVDYFVFGTITAIFTTGVITRL